MKPDASPVTRATISGITAAYSLLSTTKGGADHSDTGLFRSALDGADPDTSILLISHRSEEKPHPLCPPSDLAASAAIGSAVRTYSSLSARGGSP